MNRSIEKNNPMPIRYAEPSNHEISSEQPADSPAIFRIENVSVDYSNTPAIRNIFLDIPQQQVTAFIGSSGCGKSTLLRCLNRMNDLIPTARVRGRIAFRDQDLYAKTIDPVDVRRRIGMIFQKPNPFPKSIYDNIAFGAQINGYQGNLDALVEQSLRQVALWDEVKDSLRKSGLALSGGQQQRLCIARAIAIQPQVLLMDEPCSALDPISTLRIEELIHELKRQYTVVIVTHNMQQASRISDFTAFFNVSTTETGNNCGHLVEFGRTKAIFTHPQQEITREYVSGRFG